MRASETRRFEVMAAESELTPERLGRLRGRVVYTVASASAE
jgi:hypothetical protein